MADKPSPIENGTYTVTLGNSFYPKSEVNFHSIRYDFKPASVDTAQDSLVEIGDGNQVTVTVPHVQGSGNPHTVYKGNKRPTLKECVLIIDHDTGEVTLEQLSCAIQLKKTRQQSTQNTSINLSRSGTPIETNTETKIPKGASNSPLISSDAALSPKRLLSPLSISSSDSDSDTKPPSPPNVKKSTKSKGKATAAVKKKQTKKSTTNKNNSALSQKPDDTKKIKPELSMLKADLALSESDSNSD